MSWGHELLIGCRATEPFYWGAACPAQAQTGNKEVRLTITCGVDWAENHHDVALVDESGKLVAKRRISDDAEGYRDAPLEHLGRFAAACRPGSAASSPRCAGARRWPGRVGTGPVGMSAVGAVLAGCDLIIAWTCAPDDCSWPASSVLRTPSIRPRMIRSAIRDLTGGGAAFSIETTAVPTVLHAAVDCLGIRGRCGTVGVAPAGVEVAFEMNTSLFGRSVQGILLADRVPREFLPELVELHWRGSCRSTGSAGSTTWTGSTRPSPPPRATGKCSSRSSPSANLLRHEPV